MAQKSNWLCEVEVAFSVPGRSTAMGSDLGQVVHTHVRLSPNAICNLVPVKGGDALHLHGNVTVGLAMHHRLSGLVYLPTVSESESH